MGTYAYDEATRQRAAEMFARGMTKAAIGAELGAPPSTVRSWLETASRSKPPAATTDSDLSARAARLEMENAALRQQAAKAESRPPVTSVYTPPESNERSRWLRAEEDNSERIKRALERSRFVLDLSAESKPIAVSFISDQHISIGNTVDLRRMREDAELLAETDGCYAALVGDGIDNHIKHRSAVLAARSTPGEQYRMFDYYLSIFANRIAVMISGNHDCVDTETEALTRRGWKRYDEIEPTDEVLGYDSAASVCRWQKIDRILVKDAPQKLNRLLSACVSLTCTDNHRVLSAERRSLKWEYHTAANLRSGGRMFACGAPSDLPECPHVSDDEIRCAGLILTDGHIDKTHGYVSLFQRQSNVKEITNVLDRLGYEYRLTSRRRAQKSICGVEVISTEEQCTVRLRAESSRKVHRYINKKPDLPQWVAGLSDRQFGVFMEALIEGDGSHATLGVSSQLYGTKSFLDQVQAAAVAHGWRASLRNYRDTQWTLQLCPNPYHRINFSPSSPKSLWSTVDSPTEKVWCLSVPLTNFMVRRDGKCHFTGNCWTEDFAGIDMIQRLADSNKICYAPHEAFLEVKMREHSKSIALRHQYRLNSSFNQTHAPKQWHRNGEGIHDIYVIGHHHDPAIECARLHGKFRWFCRPGSYQICSSYSTTFGYNSTVPTCPTFVFFPEDKSIAGFADLRQGIEYLKRLR